MIQWPSEYETSRLVSAIIHVIQNTGLFTQHPGMVFLNDYLEKFIERNHEVLMQCIFSKILSTSCRSEQRL
jgi:hypothetical protein